MFGRKNKTDGDWPRNSESKRNDLTPVKDEKDKRKKRETIMERFRETGYDSGFVYHED